ncbi:MAG: hypothetical protein NC307_15425 [Roseburia sp.]|nr:hypothetical protein [Roseburia sp.]
MNTQTENMLSGDWEKKENILLGIIGAVVGILLGSVLWVLIGQIGFIAGIAGYAIVFCGMKGYEILGGKLSKAGIVLCIILSFLAIIGAEVVSLGIAAYRELGEYYSITLGQAFSLLPELLKEPELIGAVAKDLAIGYILSIWASYSSVKNIWRQTGGKQEENTLEKF